MQTISSPLQISSSSADATLIPDDTHNLIDGEIMLAEEMAESETAQTNASDHPTRKRKTPPIIQLIETVQTVKNAYRPTTQLERELISAWPGWGPYAPAFETAPREQWQTIGPQIRMLLGPEGYDAARAATPTSYFTSPFISQAIWSLAQRLGFSGGAVLEPGCGTGQILSYAPPALELQITGIEKEPFTASITQLLFPQAHIMNAPLQEVALAEGAFDLVVGNVPFADIPIYDRTLPFKEKLTLHNYCIYRSLAALRPGGIALLVTTHYTLDASKLDARRHLAELGFLLGAIRLPSYGHRWAKTAVITDLLVLQRRYPGAPWSSDHDDPKHPWQEGPYEWIAHATPKHDGVEMPTSIYYAQHPEQILGTVSRGRGMYGNDEVLIKAPDDLEGSLEGAIQRIVESTSRHKSTYMPRIDPRQLDARLVAMRGDGLKEGCFYLLKEGLVEVVQGQPKVVTKLVGELSALVRLRDTALLLMDAERDYTQTDAQLRPLRQELNRHYDAYVTAYGPLRRSTLITHLDKETGEERLSRRLPSSMYAFRTDEHYPLVLSLEVYDDETKKAKKSAIFSQRVNYPAIYKETADSPAEAIALSLDRFGLLDLTFIAKATGLPEETMAAYLGDLAYENPQTRRWEIAPTYLSGNVRSKLEIARKALLTDTKWQRNVDALEQVQPTPIPPEDIKVLLGAPWIPVEYIEKFCQEIFGLRPKILREKASGNWDVSPPEGARYSAAITSTWGTRRVSAFMLVGHLLNHKSTTVEDEGDDGKMRTNSQETVLAVQKRKEIQTRFGAWIWEDLERTKALSTLYNTLYNGVVPSHFNGEHLSFPGMDAFWQEHLYSWQRDFIARMTTNRSALCAYPVGSGKTKIQVAGAMTLRRMQLASKAAILVPNHLLEQITAEAKQLYPTANILMISRDDLSREKRRIFLARIATGDHDVVVMTHSAFEAIGVHPETKRAYIEERIKEYRQVLLTIKPDTSDKAEKRQIKRIEKQMERLRERLKERMDLEKDAGITFEQLGISYLIVDEAHFFKNLGLPTNQEKLTVTTSQRAQDMLMKLRWLEKHNGTRPFASFFTATPISNSMAEAYAMLWYLGYSTLKEYELLNLDDFASMFIETESKIEVTPNGAGFRMYERPSNFINLPEFMHLFGTIADIRSPDILADKRPDRLEHTVAVEPTSEVVEFVNGLVARSERLQQGNPMYIEGKEDNMLWVTTDGRKAALWLGLHGIPEEYPAKLDAIAIEMAKVYHRWQEHASYLPGKHKSFQIGFCDIGTPNQEKGDQVYGQIKRLLIQKGVPEQGIRFVHEAKHDEDKAKLFEACRNGEVAILLGSTAKLGTGTNIQTRCAAIHHCDAPWRPDEVEQREGRGQRPGNLYPVVEIFYYVQRRTFDAYSWQILANKARFFNQMRSTTEISREISFSDDSSLTYGQVKAAATGDVLQLELANVALAADSFGQLHASFERARDRDRQQARQYREQARSLQDRLMRLQKIAEQSAGYQGHSPFMSLRGTFPSKKEDWREMIASEVMLAVANNDLSRKIGTWRGVPIFMKVDLSTTLPYLLAVGDPYRGIEMDCQQGWLEKDNQWRFGWKIEQFFGDLDTEVEDYQDQIKKRQHQAEEFEAQAQTNFPQQEAWQKVLARKQELDRYIANAADAKTPEDLKHLAELRERLLSTAPKELTERPKPKKMASGVLPPRNPSSEEAIPTTRIEVVTTEAKEQTIEEIARTIQQSHLVGSRAEVSFGNLEHIQMNKKRKRGKNTSTQLQLQPKTTATEKQPANGEKFPKSPQPKPATTEKQALIEPDTLWDLMMTDEPASTYVAPLSTSSDPEQLTMF